MSVIIHCYRTKLSNLGGWTEIKALLTVPFFVIRVIASRVHPFFFTFSVYLSPGNMNRVCRTFTFKDTDDLHR